MTKPRQFRAGLRNWLLPLLGLLLTCAAPSLLTCADEQNTSPQNLLSQADEIFQQMSQITGLPIKAPLKKQVISRPEIEKYLIQNLHEEMTPAEIHAQEAMMRAFGLVSRDFNLEKFVVDFYTEQAAGFYDPKRKTMFIADWIPEETQTMVLSHELTHALQDQSWDLDNFLHAVHGDDDATNARQAVVEGYATAAMLQQVAGGADLGQLPSIAPLMEMVIHQQFEEYPAFSRAPYFFRMQALFPYVQGMGFIQAGLQLGGWKDLKVLFENPPEATRQIFEPQSYFHHLTFRKVALPHPPALQSVAGLRFLSESTMGELGYYSLLGQLISEDEARTTGQSWLADRYLVYERSGGNDYTLVARTRWTSQETSLAFFRDYHAILAHKYPELTTDKRSGTDIFIGSAANGVTLLLRKGDECLWAEGVPPAQADAMLAWLRAL
ncbi:MAG: hypothetical protein P4N24_01790 [Acidobacteriota bacterium]|nr:hypothetical protein [Acidobacteriota bacterium]